MFTQYDFLNACCIWTIDILAIVANLLLITAILFRTPKHLQTYSVFLLNNAIVDLVSATASALGIVRTAQDHEGSTIFIFLGPCTLVSEDLCRWCQGLHINFVQLSTIVLLYSFAYRLYILGGDILSTRNLSPHNIWIICLISLALIAIPTTGYVLEMTDVAPEMMNRLGLNGYAATNYAMLGSTRALVLATFYVTLSPIVMSLIFVVRFKLIRRIEKAKPTEKKLHVSIARALTYQLLLPCGVAAAAVFWLLDLAEIWTSEFAERAIMVTCSLFSLASPIINFTMLPPYRAMITFTRQTKSTVENVTQSLGQQ